MIYTWGRREKILIILLLIVLAVFLCYLFFHKAEPESKQASFSADEIEKRAVKPEAKIGQKISAIMVDVKGEVNRPGVFQVSKDARLYQVIEQAGGLKTTADARQVNLAAKIQDGMMIYIPRIGEQQAMLAGTLSGNEKLNLNQATEEELDQLDGLGPAKAKAIVRYREEHGIFQSVDQLKEIPGIGEKTLAKFADQLTVN
ncbi:competence protein ComEA [Seinonella peptonophila]|uniref:Competence protein ComEA n=1 Tax=Seinonella peptonophila TaxID=112248 RepID=A0A1M4W7G0_9BACL|nr:helix-hairpin-helix domain-containing protein [Seinonella peptonophila]SHE77080.1 competence protein ComEA [Seinonella peptonophila]